MCLYKIYAFSAQVRCAAAAWRPMLPAEICRNALAKLYDTICSRIVDQVLQMHDISGTSLSPKP